ncbi:MAG: cytochrome C oxidase subunit IV family protein [Alphaproteobacteria bacterium]|nr:cytochrome C oxidase subunit IV family protein [Alphaproteobacteria bacterium]
MDRRSPIFTFLVAWLVLVLLLGVSLLLAYLPLGAAHTFLPLAIALTQAFIIMAIFMKLRGRPSLKWIFAGAGFFWLAILLGLSTTDYATRAAWPL